MAGRDSQHLTGLEPSDGSLLSRPSCASNAGAWPTGTETAEGVQWTSGNRSSDRHGPEQWTNTNVARTGLEKSDSCYDSDHEVCGDEDSEYDADYGQILTARSTYGHNSTWDGGGRVGNQHHDVSRTVSDTLHAEYGDDSIPLDEAVYKKHLAFALKLGYTETQVQKAVKKLSSAANPSALSYVTENAFLAELITLGATETFTSTRESNITSAAATASTNVYNKAVPSSSQQPLHRVGSDASNASSLRHIVIDGSNVAMSHGNKRVFSCRGIALCVEYFQQRGHQEITVFVPQWRKEASTTDAPIIDQEVLLQLERQGLLTFTPSRYVQQKRVVCYDDRYILKLALETDGIVVSNDNYRDLLREDVQYRQVVEQRLLMYSFVNDRFMPPDDPLGRHGPTLQQFLRKFPSGRQPLKLSLSNSETGGSTESSGAQQTVRPACPYGRKCTYGNKCKFAHPERGNQPHKSVTELIGEQARVQMQEIYQRQLHGQGTKKKLTASISSPTGTAVSNHSSDFANSIPIEERSSGRVFGMQHKAVSRTRSMVPTLGLQTSQPQPSCPFSANLVSAEDANWPFAASPGGDGLQAMTKNFSRMFFPGDNPRLPSSSRHSHWLSPRGSTANPLVGTGDTNQVSQWHQPLRSTKSAGYTDYEAPKSFIEPCSSHPTQHDKLPPQPSANPYASFSQQQVRASSNFEASSFFDNSGRSSMAVRSELFNRLSALFPEDQVRVVMEKYPQEFNAQKLCAAILSTFPDRGGDAHDALHFSH